MVGRDQAPVVVLVLGWGEIFLRYACVVFGWLAGDYRHIGKTTCIALCIALSGQVRQNKFYFIVHFMECRPARPCVLFFPENLVANVFIVTVSLWTINKTNRRKDKFDGKIIKMIMENKQ